MKELLEAYFNYGAAGCITVTACYLALRYGPKLVEQHMSFVNRLDKRDEIQLVLLEGHENAHNKLLSRSKKGNASFSDLAEYLMIKLEKDTELQISDRTTLRSILTRIVDRHKA